MGDIVEQTKRVAAQLSTERFQGWVNPLVLNVMEAADEIERLRAENAAIRGKAIEEAAKVAEITPLVELIRHGRGDEKTTFMAGAIGQSGAIAAEIRKLKEKAE